MLVEYGDRNILGDSDENVGESVRGFCVADLREEFYEKALFG